MDYIGIDLHKEHTQICIVDAGGEILAEMRIQTSSSRFEKVFGPMPRAKILLEASGMSEWAARVLEGLGHEVIVGDTNYGVMYSARSSKVKTDVRDAQALAEACRLGLHKSSYRASDQEIEIRRQLLCRKTLVESRTKMVNAVRGMARFEGIKIPSGSTAKIGQRMRKANVPAAFISQVEPLLIAIETVSQQIDGCKDRIVEMIKNNERARILQTLPGIGPLTAAAFLSIIGEPGRFRKGAQVQAYLGLVPREYSSGERTRRGRITKAGNSFLRTLMLQASVRMLRYQPAEAADLWSWAAKLEARRGKNVARVALARRLSGVMYAMIRDEAPYRGQLQAA